MNDLQKRRLCLVFILVNIGIIWGNSLLPGELSGTISGFVRDLLAPLLPVKPQDPDSGHGLVRKLAHFTEFACLGSLLTWHLAMVRKPKALALPCGFLVASADETIQRFVPGRGPSFRDVLIDTAGVTAGIFLLLAGYAICKYWRTQNREKMDRIALADGACPDDACLRKKEVGGNEPHPDGATDTEHRLAEPDQAAARHHGGECQ